MPWSVYNSNGKLLQSLVLSDNAVTNAKVADDAIGVVELSATGTASSSTFLRGDNAWAAPGGGPSQATQAAIEAETNEDTYVPPDLVKNSPGVAKAYGTAIADGTLQANSYNISGVVRDSTGNYTWSFDDDMGNANFSAVGNVEGSQYDWRLDTPLVGSVQIHTRIQAGSHIDAVHNVTVHGDQ